MQGIVHQDARPLSGSGGDNTNKGSHKENIGFASDAVVEPEVRYENIHCFYRLLRLF